MTEATPLASEQITRKALLQIQHSVAQAKIPGNDWRRELSLIANTCEEALSATPAPSGHGAAGEVRLRMFLEILSAAGGTSDCSDWPGSWINAFCESNEGRSPDTFNTACDSGYAHATYDSDTDHGTVTLTPAGRAFLLTPPPVATAPVVDAGEALIAAAQINKPVRVENMHQRLGGSQGGGHSSWSEFIAERSHNRQVAHCANQEDADMIAFLINARLAATPTPPAGDA